MLPPSVRRRSRQLRPRGEWDRSFDDLIHPQQHRLRDLQPERLRRPAIDGQLELGRSLDGEVAGLGTHEVRNQERRVLLGYDSGTPALRRPSSTIASRLSSLKGRSVRKRETVAPDVKNSSFATAARALSI